MPLSIRKALMICAALVLVGYGAVIVWFRFNEDSLIFEPLAGPLNAPSASLHLESQDVQIRNEDGLALSARLIPPPPTVTATQAGWLLYLHGASGNIGQPAYNEAWAQFRQRGLGVLALDYRGYGASEGTISEAGIYRDALAAYRYLKDTQHISPERILLYGFSMGAAVAIELATHVRAAGLIVEGAWLSIPALGAERYPWLPVSLIAQNRFDSGDRIGRVSMPKLIVHAREDTHIPIAHSRRLFELSHSPKTFHDLGGEHGTSHLVDPSFFSAVGTFVAEQGLPRAEGQ